MAYPKIKCDVVWRDPGGNWAVVMATKDNPFPDGGRRTTTRSTLEKAQGLNVSSWEHGITSRSAITSGFCKVLVEDLYVPESNLLGDISP